MVPGCAGETTSRIGVADRHHRVAQAEHLDARIVEGDLDAEHVAERVDRRLELARHQRDLTQTHGAILLEVGQLNRDGPVAPIRPVWTNPRGIALRFGEGRISGVLAAGLGALSLLAVLCFRYPALLTTRGPARRLPGAAAARRALRRAAARARPSRRSRWRSRGGPRSASRASR